MKLYKPLFSIIVILTQLILSLKNYHAYVEWGKANSELNSEISQVFLGNSLVIFVLIIGFYEMLTKPSWFKTAIRIFLVCIIIGTEFSGLIPIDQFYYGVYNTAAFSAVVAFVLILIKFVKYLFNKINDRNLDKTQKASS